jgi:hypothetical protein
METRVYVGDISSGHIYDPIYMGKEHHARVYEYLYTIFIRLAHAQVSE